MTSAAGHGAPARASGERRTAGPAAPAGALLVGSTCALMLVTWLAALRSGGVVEYPTSIVVMLVALLAFSPVLYVRGADWPAWTIHVICVTCTAAITYGLLSVTALAPQIAGLYVLVVLLASYYLSRRAGLVHVALCTLCFGVALAVMTAPEAFPSPMSIESWLPIAGTIAITGGFLTSVRRQREGLVEQQRALQDKLELTARTDALTGLLNRLGFERRAAAHMERAAGASCALIVGDLDELKLINEAHGRTAGDRVLRGAAEVVTRGSRRLDITGRTGGEEFAILAPAAEVSDAVALAERLRRDIMVAFGDEAYTVTMSFGIAMYPRDGETLDELLVSADRALSSAKRGGRNRTMLAAQAAGPAATAAMSESDDDRARLVTAIGLAEALDLRDTGTASHSQTVARYAAMMAEQLGMDGREVERVRMAGLLHDIGKIGVPDAILNKPGALTDDEYAEMQRHPEIGARILGSDVLDDVRHWVLAHHERPDGRGYPFGLAGDQVPLQARILAVADAYEAMTADRVYRKALGHEAARAELERCRGTQFDPAVVDAFLAVLDGVDAEPEAPRLAA